MEEKVNDQFEKEEEIDSSLFPTQTKGVNTSELFKQGNDLTTKIIEETNPDELDNLTKLFTLNQKKKQIARTNKLSNLLELVDDEVINRFTQFPEAIENDDLLKYWKTTQETINQHNQDEQELPHIQINNQTNVNINSSGLDRESRAKVLEAVQEILKSSLQNDENVIDINPKGDR
jgi:hypothetical protein